jgi:hypothetical protein
MNVMLRLIPNQSFERTANGGVRLGAFASAVPPSAAAQLNRYATQSMQWHATYSRTQLP